MRRQDLRRELVKFETVSLGSKPRAIVSFDRDDVESSFEILYVPQSPDRRNHFHLVVY